MLRKKFTKNVLRARMQEEKTAPLLVHPQLAVKGCYPTFPKLTACNHLLKRINGSSNQVDIAENYDKR